jgi:FdhD protein
MAPGTAHDTSEALPEPTLSVGVERVRGGATTATQDCVAVETPVALVFNGVSHAVMMATPADLEAFALGFALSEGLIASRAECYDIEVVNSDSGCEVQLQVAASVAARLKEQRRSLAGRTGCGVCGIDSLERLDLSPEHLPRDAWVQALQPATVLRAFAQLPALQPMNAQTGAHHAAGWAEADGTVTQVMEDVGRHNALDKLLGQRALNREPFDRGFVVMSSRASYELVRKSVRLGVPVLAAISAPTSLAIDIAREAGLRLYGFCRGEQAVRYTP